MNLSDMMNGLREGAAKQTKFMGITLTRIEIDPILAEWDALCEDNERLQAALDRKRPPIRHRVGGQVQGRSPTPLLYHNRRNTASSTSSGTPRIIEP